MSDDLVALVNRLQCGVATYDDMGDAAELMEAQEAEITRLRAAINNALLEPWLDGQLNGTWQQEPIGPNETPEEAIKRLVSVRAEWAVYKNNCENPVIAELRAALATARLVPPLNPDRWRGAINDALTNWMDSIFDDETPKDALRRLIKYEVDAALDPKVSQDAADLVATARREGMEAIAEKIAGWHDAQAQHYDGMERDFRTIAEHLDPDAMQSAIRCAQGASQHRQRAADIRAAAKEGKP